MAGPAAAATAIFLACGQHMRIPSVAVGLDKRAADAGGLARCLLLAWEQVV
jgi:hypothetical protein